MEPELTALLTAQAGAVAKWQILHVVTEARFRNLVRQRRLRVLRHGVYAGVDPATLSSADRARQEAWAEVLVRRRSEVVAGATAAALHGLPVVGRPPVQPRLLLPREHGEAPRRDRPTAWTPDVHVVELSGVLVTSVARTVVDLARTRPFAFAVATVDAALRAGCAGAELDAVLHDCRTWPGARSARRALEFGDARAESPLESLGRCRFQEQGLPPPDLQVDLGGEQSSVRVDHYWAEHRTIAEADGLFKYRTPADLQAEKLREDRLRERGFEVVRYVWADVMTTSPLLALRIRRAFARAQRVA